jgi:histidinol dehydrogenase
LKIIELNERTKKETLDHLSTRGTKDYAPFLGAVEAILNSVKERGDEALFELTERFDHFALSKETIKVTREEMDAACAQTGEELMRVIRTSADNIRRFHERQLRESWMDMSRPGIMLGQRMTPLASAGVYVPGGKAAYPSSVLMNVIPAKVAGVRRIVMVTPPGRDGCIAPLVLAAASVCGVDEVYRVGGAQAIGALAYGTESISRVDKITGPGNIYVALAKRSVFGYVGLDSIAGPSEITVLADETADPAFVAADMISQAEHDEMASSVLVTTSRVLAGKVAEELERQTAYLSRREIIRKSLDSFGLLLVADSMETAVDAVDAIAPEHLEIQTRDPFETMTMVHNAGAIFLGSYSSEPLGDYFAGPNHILPTSGTARFFSPLTVDDFMKKSSVIYYSRDELEKVHGDIEAFAEAEGLTGHANSVRIRFSKEGFNKEGEQ